MTAKKDPTKTKSELLILAWRNRKDYKGYDRSKGSAFNSWRSIINTSKGKEIGYPKEWRDFDVFMSEIEGNWERGKVVLRKDKTKPYSKENCYWGAKDECSLHRLIEFTYNGETKTLLEWSRDIGVNYNGLRLRYFRHKDEWCDEWILFGKPTTKRKIDHDKEYTHRTTRMYHAYKLRDKKHGLENNLTKEFVLEECKKPCIYCGDTKRIGLDRIDNMKGHTKDNVVPCCYECNCARLDNFTHEEMLIIGKSIAEVKKNRSNPLKQ